MDAGIHVEHLNAWFGAKQALFRHRHGNSGQESHRHHRPFGLREIYFCPLPEPHA